MKIIPVNNVSQCSYKSNRKSLYYSNPIVCSKSAAILKPPQISFGGSFSHLFKKNIIGLQKVKSAPEKIVELITEKIPEASVEKAVVEVVENTVQNISGWSSKLNYDPMNPPKNIVKAKTRAYDFVLSDNFTPTMNRNSMEELIVPDYIESDITKIEIPISSQMSISKSPMVKIAKIQNQLTNISEDYANSLNWSKEKIARDLFQNFYDGHGQTLDGNQLEITKLRKNLYNIKISGQSTYSPDKAILIGESTKRDNINAAGNYGEGLKVSVLKLLKDSGVGAVFLRSNNWQVKYNLVKSNINTKKVLAFSLDNAEKVNGSSIEFKTTDQELIKAITRAVNFFYHSGNIDFKCPDFENQYMGIKKLGKDAKGSIYIAGQRFEFNNDWQGLPGFNIFFKEKPPSGAFEISRDRLSISSEDLGKIVEHFAKKSSKNDVADMINLLRDYWSLGDNQVQPYKLAKTILKSLVYDAQYCKHMYLKFPDNYLSKGLIETISPSLLMQLSATGYKICDYEYSNIGMNKLSDFLAEYRNHCPLNPTESEVEKIGLIKDGLSLFGNLKPEFFSDVELNPNIYIFDAKSANESNLSKVILAEAIINNKEVKGFWLDREYLKSTSFSDILAWSMHELAHKFGGDGDRVFSDRLTNINKKVMEKFISAPETSLKLKEFETRWNSLIV